MGGQPPSAVRERSERRMRRKFAARILILIAIVGAYAIYRHRGPATNSRAAQHAFAPDFTLPQLSGPPLKLSDYRGKVVLLDFWATWCEPCRVETPFLVDLQNKYRDQGLQIIGVSMDDTPDPVPGFYQQFKMNYPVVMGNAKIGEEYGGVLGLPIAFLLDREGRIQKKHIGATDASTFEREVQTLLQGG
jgi:cytochrome c biogenesis protein CcmG/thiol:disulfide interchange protein DsbE